MALTIGVGASPVAADEPIAFSHDELLIDRPGTVTNLAEVVVSADQVGKLCTVAVVSQNQASVHNGNDLIITTGEVATVIPDVEAEANAAVDLSVDIILGPTITVDLRMGPDWVSSLGFELRLDCAAGETVLADDPLDCADPLVVNPGTGSAGGEAEEVTDGVLHERGQTPDCSSAVDPDQNPPPPPPPPVEMPTVSPLAEPQPCPEGDAGSLTIVPTDCPNPLVDGPTDSETEPTPPPAPAAPAPPESEPAEQTPETEAATGAETETETDEEPEVLGIQVERLPQTPAAPAIPASPTYNG